MTEAAIVGPIIIFSIIVVFQGALFARSILAASDAASAGARAGTIAATDQLADYDILSAVNRALSSTNRRNVQHIVIFKATGPDYSIPPGCATTAGPSCNRYNGSDLKRSRDDFGPGGTMTKDDDWPAATRFQVPGERLGVEVRLTTDAGLGPLPSTVTRTFVALPEPK